MERAIAVLPADDLTVAREYYIDRLGFAIRFEVSEDGRSGVTISRPPVNEPWGGRTFGVQDPSGNTIFVIGPVK